MTVTESLCSHQYNYLAGVGRMVSPATSLAALHAKNIAKNEKPGIVPGIVVVAASGQPLIAGTV